MTKRTIQESLRAELAAQFYVSSRHDDDHWTILEQAMRRVGKPDLEFDVEVVNEIIAKAGSERKSHKYTKSIFADLWKKTYIELKLEFERSEPKASPPALGEALLVLLCPKDRVDAVLGDLAEQFETEVQKKGTKRAALLYWVRAVRSFGPLFIAKLRNTGFWLYIIEIGRRWIGS